ncbi:MAG: hypothetical protein Salg2KO_06930 [Salibacteraceae bacterium]
MKSDTFQINTTPAEIISFVGAPANLIDILPADRIEQWKSDGNTCSFKIKGLAHIDLVLDSVTDTQITYISNSEKPFPFKLKITATQDDAGKSSLSAEFDPEVNAFMATMIKTPMTNFLNHLGSAISNRFK